MYFDTKTLPSKPKIHDNTLISIHKQTDTDSNEKEGESTSLSANHNSKLESYETSFPKISRNLGNATKGRHTSLPFFITRRWDT